ncbi:hypothetical protein V8F20_010116 [Naviculisporaceae sp. PSN 640]
MMPIRSIVANLLAISPLALAQEFPAPDRNSTTIAGAFQHVGQGESLVNVTAQFTVPTLHLRYNKPTPQGTTIFVEIDPEDCGSSLRFGLNSIIYGDQTQRHEFFHHWSGEDAVGYPIPDFPLAPGDEIRVEILPSADAVTVTFSNLSKPNATLNKSTGIISPSKGQSLCLKTFGFVFQDPTLVRDDIPLSDRPPFVSASMAEFNAIAWSYGGGLVSGGKEYGIKDAEMVYMTTKTGDNYRVVAIDTGSTGGHSSLVFVGHAGSISQDQGHGKGKGQGHCGDIDRHAEGCIIGK